MRPKIVFECARVDPNVPYEDSISYIANYAKAGKIDGITISEIGSKSIKKAASTFPISFTEVELSLMCQDLISNGVLKTASELGIPIIAYFPLCGGYLTDSATQMGTNFLKDEHKGDVRNHLVKLLKENIPQNMKLFKKLYEFSRCKENFS
ncbi:uncharacterized protein PRCAT00003456001 [Priceomyces carsonii]|uniref:uncharacterized protein n=1 Tax=Priceomyces carsonii TaxID=28549 RepID=UPI002ED80A56|nr:unnamed protein product [Priceomyces carsonii]